MQMNEKEFVMLCQAGVPREFQAGALIFREGAVSGEMYFILSGSVDLKFEGDRDDKTIGIIFTNVTMLTAFSFT